MIGPERGDDAHESALMEAYMRQHFAVKLVDGAPASDEAPLPDEDEQFASYMRQHFGM